MLSTFRLGVIARRVLDEFHRVVEGAWRSRRKLFEEYLRRLSEEPGTEILFGSRARGETTIS